MKKYTGPTWEFESTIVNVDLVLACFCRYINNALSDISVWAGGTVVYDVSRGAPNDHIVVLDTHLTEVNWNKIKGELELPF